MNSVEFSTNETVILQKEIVKSVEITTTALENIDFVYEIERSTAWIYGNNFKKVCLQFPDFLLGDSTIVARRLEDNLGEKVYILGDTAYESCCVDYVAAAHINADAIVHYGPVCFSVPSGKIPCLIIYEKKSLDLEVFKQQFTLNSGLFLSGVTVIIDDEFVFYLDLLKEIFKESLDVSILPIGEAKINLKNVIFISGNHRKIVNLKLSFIPKLLYYYDPNGNKPELVNYDQDIKILKRRNFLMEKIKDSKTIGIIIGTLGVKNYLKVIERIKNIVTTSGRKYYVISVGKPTVAKLANFLELDIYCVITCAMNAIYDSTDYFKPIVTPYDIEKALNPRELNFSYDYNNYSFESELTATEVENIKQHNSGDVSLISGRIRLMENDENHGDSMEIAVRSSGALALNSGAGFLAARSWGGLEQRLGETEAQKAVEGRRGIAQGYVNEES